MERVLTRRQTLRKPIGRVGIFSRADHDELAVANGETALAVWEPAGNRLGRALRATRWLAASLTD